METLGNHPQRDQVFAEIWRHGPLSRRDLSERTGFTKSTVFQLTEDLLSHNLIGLTGLRSSGSQGGRRAALLEANPDAFRVAGVHIGVTRTSVALADTFGRIIDLTSWPTVRRDPDQTFDRIQDEISHLSAKHSRPAAVGVAVPGLIDAETGVCLLAPNLGWRDIPITDEISRRVGVNTFALNTVQAMAVAEAGYLGHQPDSTMALLYVGTGVGSALMLEGKLLRGQQGLAGEIGHLGLIASDRRVTCSCGRVGCLETLVGASALVERATEAGITAPGRRMTPEVVAQAAQAGDEGARALLTTIGHELGQAGALLVQVFNPETIVLAGSLASMGDLLLVPLRDTVIEQTQGELHRNLEIRRSLLDNQGKLRGAILLGLAAVAVPVAGL